MTVIPSEADVLAWFHGLSNWGRWGSEDRLGTLNLVTAERRAAAAALVRDGITVSCAWDVGTERQPDHVFGVPQRFMLSTGEGLPAEPRWGGAAEYVGLICHGYAVTHVDGLSHYFWDGRMYNDRPASAVTARGGATEHDITALRRGIVSRGVLLDAATARGGAWLEPGEAVLPVDLDAAAERQGVAVGEGDVVLLRTGYGRKVRERGRDDTAAVGRAGWHAACLPWLHDRGVAAIGCDTAQDVHPSGYDALRSPVHAVGIVAMGLWLVDNCDLEELAAACQRAGRWEFLFVLAPLPVVGATGSAANPLAVL